MSNPFRNQPFYIEKVCPDYDIRNKNPKKDAHNETIYVCVKKGGFRIGHLMMWSDRGRGYDGGRACRAGEKLFPYAKHIYSYWKRAGSPDPRLNSDGWDLQLLGDRICHVDLSMITCLGGHYIYDERMFPDRNVFYRIVFHPETGSVDFDRFFVDDVLFHDVLFHDFSI